MNGVTYDAGALIAAESNNRNLWALHDTVLQRGLRPLVSAGVLAQVWRGGPQPALSRLLRGCIIEDLNDQRARATGVTCAASRTTDVVDASVVTAALGRDDLIVTSDPDDLFRVADGVGRRIRMHVV